MVWKDLPSPNKKLEHRLLRLHIVHYKNYLHNLLLLYVLLEMLIEWKLQDYFKLFEVLGFESPFHMIYQLFYMIFQKVSILLYFFNLKLKVFDISLDCSTSIYLLYFQKLAHFLMDRIHDYETETKHNTPSINFFYLPL